MFCTNIYIFFFILLIFSNVIVDAFYVRYIPAVAELCFVGCVALINVSEVLSFLGQSSEINIHVSLEDNR